jgi:hypothetical protein
VRKFDIAAGDQNKKTDSVVFLKTHKTGSSTIQNILLRYADMNDLVVFLPESGNHVLSRQPVSETLLPCEGSKADIICLHTDYKPEQLSAAIKENPTFLSILREPDSLFHSIYRFAPSLDIFVDALKSRFKKEILLVTGITTWRSTSSKIFPTSWSIHQNLQQG